MRDYARISPRFWTGTTGKQIKALGAEHQVVALYLLTAPQSNMIGLYYLPIAYLAHESGVPGDRCLSILADLSRLGFADYDHDAEVVWVRNAVNFQLYTSGANATDKQKKGAANRYAEAPECSLLGPFAEKYSQLIPIQPRKSESIDTHANPITMGIDRGNKNRTDQDTAQAQSKSEEQEQASAQEGGVRLSDFAVQIAKAKIAVALGSKDHARYSQLGKVEQYEIDHAIAEAKAHCVCNTGYVFGVIEGQRNQAAKAKAQPPVQKPRRNLSPSEERAQARAEEIQAEIEEHRRQRNAKKQENQANGRSA